MGNVVLIPFGQNVPLWRSTLPLLQIHRICLALQALEFLASGLGHFFILQRSRGGKPPVQEHRASWVFSSWGASVGFLTRYDGAHPVVRHKGNLQARRRVYSNTGEAARFYLHKFVTIIPLQFVMLCPGLLFTRAHPTPAFSYPAP